MSLVRRWYKFWRGTEYVTNSHASSYLTQDFPCCHRDLNLVEGITRLVAVDLKHKEGDSKSKNTYVTSVVTGIILRTAFSKT